MICLAAQPQAAAMVTDLQGRASIQNGALAETLVLTAEAGSNCPITLDPGARIVLVSYATGEEITATGPARFTLDAKGHPAGPGRGIQVTPAKGLRLQESLKPGGLAQASLVMRDAGPAELALRSPLDRVVADARPRFAWEDLGTGAQYRFRLQGPGGQHLFAAEPAAPQADLPPGLRLQEGVAYVWAVSATLPDGTVRKAQADLALLGRAARIRLAALRSHAPESFSHQVAYAAALQEAGLLDQAKPRWRALQALRPDDPTLAAYAK
jgi:hypothetical protein